MSKENLKKAKKSWEEKRGYLEYELSIDSDPTTRFGLKKKIEECEAKSRRLEEKIRNIKIIELQAASNSIQANLQPVSPDHKCPDCLFFKIEGTEITDNGLSNINLYLTINLNHKKLEILDGSVTFGIKAGELKLFLKNCLLPFQNRRVKNPVLISINGDIYWEISNIGDEENQPGWRFQTSDETENILKRGSIIQEQWAKIQVTNKPCHIKGVFEVFKEDIALVKSNFLPDDINDNKRALIETQIISYLYKEYFNPYLSRVEFNYD